MTPRRVLAFVAATALALAGCSGAPEVTEPDAVSQPVSTPESVEPTGDGSAGATSETEAPSPATTTTDAGESPGATSTAPPTRDAATVNQGALAAIQRAEESAEGVAFQLDDQDDGSWRVEVAVGNAEVEVTVSADGSQVVGTRERGQLDADDAAGVAAATVSMRQAVETALQPGDGMVEEVELDREGTGFEWVVHLDRRDDDIDVHIDVTTGQVLRTDR